VVAQGIEPGPLDLLPGTLTTSKAILAKLKLVEMIQKLHFLLATRRIIEVLVGAHLVLVKKTGSQVLKLNL
jgi:hypothetical protein